MPNTRANGVNLEFEEIGEGGSAPLLLIMGLGAQMIAWDDGFCHQLADRGFRVIRFDNRDVGRSTKFIDRCPNPTPFFVDLLQGKTVAAPYTLDDMADDAAALLQELGIPAAHIVGASMGGMIAQLLAIRHPDRALTLTSIMSTTGEPDLPQGEPAVLALLSQPLPAGRQTAIEQAVATSRLLAGGGFEFDEARSRRLAEASYDRDSDATGLGRQLLAIMTAPGRRAALRSLKAPSLVIHGAADPLVPLACGVDTAESISGAEMLVIDGMGHELPEGAWSRVIDAVAVLAQQRE